MLIVNIKFINGQYHATPWGRNVSEGVAEFPPSPYRLIRAIIDSWLRKNRDIKEQEIEKIIMLMSDEKPKFKVPPYTQSFIKSYMSKNDRNPEKKDLIYDGFIRVVPGSFVKIIWENAQITEQESLLLSRIVSAINYLGRSDSWVDISISSQYEELNYNIFPIDRTIANEDRLKSLRIASPVSKAEYNGKISWLSAFQMSTNDVIAKNIKSPPSLTFHDYYVDEPKIYENNKIKHISAESKVNTFIYSLHTSVPPQVIETLPIAERMHTIINGRYKKKFNKASENFSGRSNMTGHLLTGHKHTYILPVDRNEDGRIDRIVLKSVLNFDEDELYVLDSVSEIWQSGGRPNVKLIPIEWGDSRDMETIFKSNIFRSVTPFIPTRHFRKGRGIYGEWLKNEVLRELKNHDMPLPVTVSNLKTLDLKGHTFYWLEFMRSRKGDEQKVGYGFEIKFEDYVEGPFSIGYGAHFGLGMFYPVLGGNRNGRKL